jgi:hypothetical protein
MRLFSCRRNLDSQLSRSITGRSVRGSRCDLSARLIGRTHLLACLEPASSAETRLDELTRGRSAGGVLATISSGLRQG